jgi:ribulose bisphosphate carboxylase small subunit
VGEEIIVSARVLELDAAKNRARIETMVTRPNGEIGCQGETTVELAKV